jgi:hypothetical protein
VILRGNVLVTFKHTSPGTVQPTSLKFEGFTGTAKSGNRKLVAKNLRGAGDFKVKHVDGHGKGKFSFEFKLPVLDYQGGRLCAFGFYTKSMSTYSRRVR